MNNFKKIKQMTDKQMHSKNLSVELDKSRTTATSLIIDDIDVKQCKYFNSYQKIVRNNECIVDMQNACIEEIKTKPCSQKHNCYFKNWQRKEQECEELKAELELFKTSNQTTIDQLKKENDALFKAIEEVNKINKRLESENEELKKQLESTKGLVTIGNRQLAEALEKNEELEKLYKANKNCFEKTEKLLDENEQERMKLKHTLEEIKLYCLNTLYMPLERRFIIDKINEVKE